MDYHVHSNHSCDGRSTIFEMCQKAIELGIVEIGFSDHMDFEPEDEGFGFFNYERYTSEIESAQKFFKDKLVIRKGVEVDYQFCFEGDIRRWLKNKQFDFVVGSVHYLEHGLITQELIKQKGLEKTYNAYFDEVIRSVKSNLFNVVGHLDVTRACVDSRVFESENIGYEEDMYATLEEIRKRRIYLEINSKSSLQRDKCTNTLPSKEIVKEFVQDGGKLISLGSDAHSAKWVGSRIQEILSFLEGLNGNRFKLPFE